MKRAVLLKGRSGEFDGLKKVLAERGFAVYDTYSTAAAIFVTQEKKIDCIVLDLDAVEENSLEICNKIVEKTEAYKICLSSSEDLDSILSAYEQGADLVLRKPCDSRDLLARICSMLDRKYRCNAFNKIQIEAQSRSVSKGKKSVRLSVSENKILQYLLQRPNQDCSVSDLLKNACGKFSLVQTESAVQRRVKFIKEKLASIGADDLLYISQLGDNCRAVLSH